MNTIECHTRYYNGRRHSSLKRRSSDEAYTRAVKLPPSALSSHPSGAITTSSSWSVGGNMAKVTLADGASETGRYRLRDAYRGRSWR